VYFLGGLGSCNPFVGDASLHFLLLSFNFVVEVQSDELHQLFQDDQEPLKLVRSCQGIYWRMGLTRLQVRLFRGNN